MYTRVMKVEDEDNVDAGFVKRGREEEEEVDKYVRVMRRAEETNAYSRPALEDLDQEILKRRVDGKMDGNVFEIMLMKKDATKKGRKYDQIDDILEDWATNPRGAKFQRVLRSDKYRRVTRGNQILFLRPIMKRQDEVAFSRGMLTRVG